MTSPMARVLRTLMVLGIAQGFFGPRSVPAAAAQTLPPYNVDYPIDGAVTAAIWAGVFLVDLIPVNEEGALWASEVFPFDAAVHHQFSEAAGRWSDVTMMGATLAPFALKTGQGIDEEFGEFALLYTQAVGSAVLLARITKKVVQRPRPYAYSRHPLIEAYTKRQGEDAHQSFVSGHAALSFAAAVAGSHLFARATEDRPARAAVWGVQMALAAATANLRVRAGRHFYSDVLAGALVGAGAGVLVPWLHRGNDNFELRWEEWAAIGGGTLTGLLLTQIAHFDAEVAVPAVLASLRPTLLPGGAGIKAGARF